MTNSKVSKLYTLLVATMMTLLLIIAGAGLLLFWQGQPPRAHLEAQTVAEFSTARHRASLSSVPSYGNVVGDVYDGIDNCQMPTNLNARSLIQSQKGADRLGAARSPPEKQTAADCFGNPTRNRQVFLQVGSEALSFARLDDLQEHHSEHSGPPLLAAANNASDVIEMALPKVSRPIMQMQNGSITLPVDGATNDWTGSPTLESIGAIIMQVRSARTYLSHSRGESILILALAVLGCATLSLLGAIVFLSKASLEDDYGDDRNLVGHTRDVNFPEKNQQRQQLNRQSSFQREAAMEPRGNANMGSTAQQRSPRMRQRSPAEQLRGGGLPQPLPRSRADSPRASISPAPPAELGPGGWEAGGAQRFAPAPPTSMTPPGMTPPSGGKGGSAMTPPRSPGSAGRAMRTTSSSLPGAEGQRQAAGSAGAIAVPRTTSGVGPAGSASMVSVGTRQLCPGLVVPKGSECVVAVPIRPPGSSQPMPTSFNIRELSGPPVIQVQLSPPAWGTGVGTTLTETSAMVELRTSQGIQPLIAFCKAGPESAGRRSAYVYDANNELFAHVTKVMTPSLPGGKGPFPQGAAKAPSATASDLARPCYVLTSGRIGLQWLLDGNFKEHAVHVTSEQRRMLADTEPCPMKFDPSGTYYKLRVTECVDVGLVLCALLSIDLMEGLR